MSKLSWNEIRDRAAVFATERRATTHESGESQSFWAEFLEVFGVNRRRCGAFFEHATKKTSGSFGFIDLFWPGKLLVEQKSAGGNLKGASRQAFEYLATLPDHDLPEFIVVCDFATFQLFDSVTGNKVIEFNLEDLPKNVKSFGFIIDRASKNIVEEDPVNRQAAESMARLHNRLQDDNYAGRDLELLLVRLVFLMFADDSGIFEQGVLLDYVRQRTAEDNSDLGPRLIHIFQILNTPEDKRQANLDEELASLPYVNGKLFEEKITTPSFSGTMRYDLIEAMKLDWSKVSPAIFGSMFQGVMDEKQRRDLGAHYTSEVNILKVIKPLFLDGLYDEFRLATRAGPRKKYDELRKLHDKIANLKFLDPACGCGNFLVITYRELRRLEHKILAQFAENPNQISMLAGTDRDPIKVNVDQMYGIEIEEFPSLVAQTALWLTDHQMNMEYSRQAARVFRRIPLTTSATIVTANALTEDWAEVIDSKELDYILGNPPFSGSRTMSKEQKADLRGVVGDIKEAGFLDYVAGWYFKSAELMRHNPIIESALVSTNSITQGEQVKILWQPLLESGICINFAHQTFKWSNDAKGSAAVYCVIIGFSLRDNPDKIIFEYYDVKGEPTKVEATSVNPYLIDAPNIFVGTQQHPLSDVPEMSFGNMPADGGNLILSAAERGKIVAQYPNADPWIYELVGAKELIQGKVRYCLWLTNISPNELRAIPPFLERVERNRAVRAKSARPQLADAPMLFAQTTADPNTYETCLVVPRVSSEGRDYVPIAFAGTRQVVGDSCLVIPGATLYHFGILTSRLHMAWMRAVGGRLKSDYRYSKDIVYNNFVWPDTSGDQEDMVVELAQAVLDARAEHSESTLADLYDPNTMPLSLRKAHNNLDRLVDRLYGLPVGAVDSDRVELLFGLYRSTQ